MSADLHFLLRLMQRRARLFGRQIAVALLLTVLALGFLASTYAVDRAETDQLSQRAQTLP
jgi:predicted LPLAT superfamily acyltransferase